MTPDDIRTAAERIIEEARSTIAKEMRVGVEKQQKEKFILNEQEIEDLRETFSKFMKNINWMSRTSRLSYDWTAYCQQDIVKMCMILKVDLGTGNLKKKDKVGHWR